jgi:hypothetical protein
MMKKSKVIKLVLVAGMAVSCSSRNDYETSSRLHIRGDSTSHYTNTHSYMGHGYYHFIPYGFYSAGQGYRHGGYESSGFSSKATVRSGFGHSGMRVGG